MKDTAKTIKKNLTYWKKIFANHVSNEEILYITKNTQNSTVKNKAIKLENGQKI